MCCICIQPAEAIMCRKNEAHDHSWSISICDCHFYDHSLSSACLLTRTYAFEEQLLIITNVSVYSANMYIMAYQSL